MECNRQGLSGIRAWYIGSLGATNASSHAAMHLAWDHPLEDRIVVIKRMVSSFQWWTYLFTTHVTACEEQLVVVGDQLR